MNHLLISLGLTRDNVIIFESIINLGIWCNRQRQTKKGNADYKLTEEQIRRLNSIDFIWEPSARVTQKRRLSIRL